MSERPNILVVCGRNKRRSRTAEYLYKNDRRFSIRSVGLSPKSERQIKPADIDWADLILVMEQGQSSRISSTFRHMELPQIEVLHIADEYDYRQPELIDLLNDRVESILQVTFGL